MFIFPAYIALTWSALWLLRRTWTGGALLLLSLVGVGAVERACNAVFTTQDWVSFTMPFYALVLAGGGAIIVLRKRIPAEFGCRSCGYDLAGLARPVCPECGTRSHEAVPAARNTAPHQAQLSPPSRPELRARVDRYLSTADRRPRARSRRTVR